jgi:SLED domain
VLLPQFVGPGPVILVLKEVLSMLINVAYKPSRVLRELQLDGPPSPHMHQQVLQAK